MTEDGFPANRTYSDQMFQWIEKTLSESDDFDFLFVAGHYQVIDPSQGSPNCKTNQIGNVL